MLPIFGVLPNKIVIIGFGLVGPALFPLLAKELGIQAEQIIAIAADEHGRPDAEAQGIAFRNCALTNENYIDVLSDLLAAGDWLINVSVDVSSISLIEWCQGQDIFYLDTCVEPWVGGYEQNEIANTTNYELRRQALGLAKHGAATAIIAHGANPGLITHLAKEGLLKIAESLGVHFHEDWGRLAEECGVRVVQIAEFDSQDTQRIIQDGEFVNTWSVDGFMTELLQRTEIGWGTHEDGIPSGAARHHLGDQSAIYLKSMGVETLVHSWSPSVGGTTALAVPHHEAASLANLFTIKSRNGVKYRPTVYYAYRPSSMTMNSINAWEKSGYRKPTIRTVVRDEITSGTDDLGVLFLTTNGGYWYGSRLTTMEARVQAPFNSATSLQVAAGIVGALVWLMENPRRSVVEAEMMDHRTVLDVARPYLGSVEMHKTIWMPGEPGSFDFRSFVKTSQECT